MDVMRSDLFPGRLDQLRRAFTEGPIATLNDLARVADVDPTVVRAGYRSEIGEDLRWRISDAAAELLSVKIDMLPPGAVLRDAMGAWLVGGESVPWLADFVAWLPTQAACVACNEWFTRGDKFFDLRLRMCAPCRRAKENPKSAAYEKALRERLPEIRAVDPELAGAVERTLDQRLAPTYQRFAEQVGRTAAAVGEFLKSMRLDKRTIIADLVLAGALTIAPVAGGVRRAEANDIARLHSSGYAVSTRRRKIGRSPQRRGAGGGPPERDRTPRATFAHSAEAGAGAGWGA